MRKNQKGFGLIEMLASLVVIALVAFGSWYVWQHNKSKPTSTKTTVQNGEVKLYGKIASDGCFTNNAASAGRAPIGDVGCSILVNGYTVDVRLGNIRPPTNRGMVTGLDENRDQTGQYVDVYAKLVDANSASIWVDSKYYVHIH